MKTFIDEYIEQGRKKGRKEGRKEGRQEGRQEAGYKILSNQLTHRFGTLPEWATEKIDSANIDTLEKWSLRLLTAKKLDEIFH